MSETTLRESIEARISPEPTSGCWLWIGTLSRDGYAYYGGTKIRVRVARFLYQVERGPITDDLTLDHLCRVRSCVNPWHLEAVPNKVNVLRGDTLPARNLAKTHCPQGHPYDEQNTERIASKRYCRICRSRRFREQNERRRARYRADPIATERRNAYERERYHRAKERT